ncbi:M56 family metallopeptidase [Cellulophaga baltica]|uniref:M56 family metallopeptidase n=1 Tax=Cellulophaga TaxID=104264 RepID=UPI001C0686CA|nr:MULTISPECIES: M56 family metallopeptidase [Cellulophaga]MBU2997735.1 M56 family metallopeptidase [Cellulophaga baltica]MDO6769130.1 M56 family metallopeptidase [Cellulophaga sp. 1_MG-2023]
MEAFLIYLLKSSGILFIFWLIFTSILKKDTLFKTHRLYLLGGIIISTFLPFLEFTKSVIISSPQNLIFHEVKNSISSNDSIFIINWPLILFTIYTLGVVFFSVRLLIQFISLKKILNKCITTKDGGYTIAQTNEDINPFSFFNTIVINPELYSSENYNAILIHEKTHASQKHSIDMLLVQLISIYQWVNPFVWLYKKIISQNLEFITDAESINILDDKKAYQYLLLDQTCHYYQKTSITNTFYNSLIKKRIVMLNQQKSN